MFPELQLKMMIEAVFVVHFSSFLLLLLRGSCDEFAHQPKSTVNTIINHAADLLRSQLSFIYLVFQTHCIHLLLFIHRLIQQQQNNQNQKKTNSKRKKS